MTILPKEILDDLKGKADWMATYVHGLSNHLSREELNSYRNTYAKFIELTTPYATQLHTLQQENELKYQIAINSNKLKDHRIEKLATENERLRKALEDMIKGYKLMSLQQKLWFAVPGAKVNEYTALTAQPEADNNNQQNL